jgi:hypothetical protein
VTRRPEVGPFTRGNSWDDHRTTPIMPRVPEGPRSRSGAFLSLPSPVTYGGSTPSHTSGAVVVRSVVCVAPRSGGAPVRLRRGWPGRGMAA